MKMQKTVSKLVLVGAVAAIFSSVTVFKAEAKPEFAKKEGKKCNYCHLATPPKRGFRGIYYKAHKLSFKGFTEATEAKKAGVKAGGLGKDSAAKASYKG
jgi:hypothetical protein